MSSRKRLLAASGLATVAVVVAACGASTTPGTPTPVAPIALPSSRPPPLTAGATPPAPATTTPPPLTAKGPRPADGEVRPAKRSGLGELNITNGTSSDAYVTLARDGKAALTVYVWKGSSTKVGRVADGDYVLFYSIGEGWNGDVRRFTSDVAATRFDETLMFRTTRTTNSIYTVGLRPTADGNASSSPVSDDEIPR